MILRIENRVFIFVLELMLFLSASYSYAETLQRPQVSEVKNRVDLIYKDVLSNYSRGIGNSTALDTKYLSSGFKEDIKRAQKRQEQLGDEIGPVDWDHWIAAQDHDRLSFSTGSINGQGKGYKVKIHINNCGSMQTITVILVKEKGLWMINDFISEGQSERKALYMYSFDLKAYFEKAFKNKNDVYSMIRENAFKRYLIYKYGTKIYNKALKYSAVAGPIEYNYDNSGVYYGNAAQAGMFGENETRLYYDPSSNQLDMEVLENGFPVK